MDLDGEGATENGDPVSGVPHLCLLDLITAFGSKMWTIKMPRKSGKLCPRSAC